MPEPIGSPTTEEAQEIYTQPLQVAGAADGSGTQAVLPGYDGPSYVELQKTGAGTTSLNLEGSFDGATWYAIGYQQVNAVAVPTRAVAAIAVGAGAVNAVYQLLDYYPIVRCRLSATAGAVVVNTTLRAIPVL